MTKRKRRHRRSVDVRINWLQPHAEGFKEWLDERNYSPATIIEVVRLLALWADWVRAKGFELETLDAGLAASASVFRGNKKARAPQGAAKLFVTYLRNEGVLPPAHKPSLEETWPELAAFRHWMREQRGIKDSTLDTYQQTLTDLLAALGTDPAAYTATAIRDFVLKRAKGPLKITHPYYNYRLPFNEESAIQTPSLELYFPENSFYENLDLHYEPILEDSYGIYSLAHQIHYPATPVHHYFQIGVRPTILIPDQLKSRAFVALCSPGGAIVNCGGEWKDGFLQTRVRSFGTYCILADEEAPSILPLNLKEDMSRAASIAFRVKDNYETAANVPGLKYRGTIDGHWVLFEYDAKHGQLEYFFENTLAQGRHQLRLEVEDAVGNIALFEYQFRR